MRMKRSAVWVAALAALLVVLSACGGDSGVSPTASAKTSQSGETAAISSAGESVPQGTGETADPGQTASVPTGVEMGTATTPYEMGIATSSVLYTAADKLTFVNGETGFALSLPRAWEGAVTLTYDDTACRVTHKGDASFVVRSVQKGAKTGAGEVKLGSNGGFDFYCFIEQKTSQTDQNALLQAAQAAFFPLDEYYQQAKWDKKTVGYDSREDGFQAASLDGMFYVNGKKGFVIRLPENWKAQLGGVRYDAASVYFYPPKAPAEAGNLSPFYVYSLTEEQVARGVLDELELTAHKVAAGHGIQYYVVLEEESGSAGTQVQQVKEMISLLDA